MSVVSHPRVWLERRRARRDADFWIGHGFASRYVWRVAELTCERERKTCARSVRRVIDELEGTKLPGAAPICRAALRDCVRHLEMLERLLLAPEPVSAAGMLAVNELLTSPGSCLFAPVEDVEACLRHVLENLEVR